MTWFSEEIFLVSKQALNLGEEGHILVYGIPDSVLIAILHECEYPLFIAFRSLQMHL